MNQSQNVIRPVEPGEGSREAYLVGRYLRTVHAWAESVAWFDTTNAPEPWKWDFPFTAFGHSFDMSPADLIMEIHDALRSLAQLGAVDSGLLVEMHRSLDELMEGSVELAEHARERKRDEMCDGYWNVMDALSILDELAKELLVKQGEPLKEWRLLGVLLGDALYHLAYDAKRDVLSDVMTAFVELGRSLLPESALGEVVRRYGNEAQYTGFPKRQEPAGQLITVILKLDAWIFEHLAKPVSPDPYLIFDDERRTITFLGTEISFDDIPKKISRRS